MERINEFNGPFTVKEFSGGKIDLTKAREILDGLVVTGKLQSRKIARMYLYWKKEEPNETDHYKEVLLLQDENKKLTNEINKLKQLLKPTKDETDPESSQWKGICMDMAKTLAEMRGVTLTEVLTYFGID